MEIILDNLRFQHPHIRGDVSIDCRAKFLRRYLTLHLHARYLPLGVNAGIRSSRSINYDLATVDKCQRARQLSLHGTQLALHLPAMKVRAVVLDDEFEIHCVIHTTKVFS